MFRITEYVPASTIWSGAKDHHDMGGRPGLVRGYNLEVRSTEDGRLGWMSCCYIHGEPENYFSSESYAEWLFDLGMTPTGRISFRGYGYESYDPDERETFITKVPDGLVPRF